MRRIFFDILEINLAVSLVILLLLPFIRGIRRRYGAACLKVIWLLLAVRLLIPYNFNLPFVNLKLLNYPGFNQTNEIAESDFTEDETETGIKEDIKEEVNEGLKTEISLEGNAITTTPKHESTYDETFSTGAGSIMNETITGTPSKQTSSKQQESGKDENHTNSNPFPFSTLLPIIWLFGFLVSLGALLVEYVLFRSRMQRRVTEFSDEAVLHRIRRLAGKKRRLQNLAIGQCDGIQSPMLIGLLHPVLIVPAGISDWDEDVTDMVLLHELSHMNYGDLFYKAVVNFACVMNWFNPFVYVLRSLCFFDLELACDEKALALQGKEERAKYAEVLLSVALAKRGQEFFSTNFIKDKNALKARIDYIFNTDKKKNGVLVTIIVAVFLLLGGLLISCGYVPKLKENIAGGNGENILGNTQKDTEEIPINWYNARICEYGDKAYLATEEGIYRLGKGGVESFVFPNEFMGRRSMAQYGDYLYFCGEGKGNGNSVYRLNLKDESVEGALTGTTGSVADCQELSIYRGIIYINRRIAFRLNENGELYEEVPTDSEEFIYKEYNEYMDLLDAQMKTGIGTPEYDALSDELEERYLAALDVAALLRLLNGNQVVSKLQDGEGASFYLETKGGDYQYLCDGFKAPELVTEDGFYFIPKRGANAISYYNFKTGQTVSLFESSFASDIKILNYDAENIYFMLAIYGPEADGYVLVVLPRKEGNGAGRIIKGFNQSDLEWDVLCSLDSLYGNCPIYDGKIYIKGTEGISLDVNEGTIGSAPKESYSIKEQDSDSLYRDIIASAEKCFDDRKRGDGEAFNEDNIYDISFDCFSGTGADGDTPWQITGYLIMDINGDSIDELIIGANPPKEEDDWRAIYDIFTTRKFADGYELVHVLSGWTRSRYYLCENGMILNEGSSGASESTYSYFSFDGESLQFAERIILTQRGGNEGSDGYFYTTIDNPEDMSDISQAVPIEEEQRREIMEKYQKVNLDFVPFEANRRL